MKNLRDFLIKFFVYTLFFFSPLFIFAQTTGGYTINLNNGRSVAFPYQIKFTQGEINILNSLSDSDLKKLVQIATQVFNQNKTTSANVNQNSQNNQSTTPSSPQTLKPIPLSNTSISKNKPADYSGASGLNDGDPNSNPNFNPNYAPRDTVSQTPLDNSSVDFSKLPEGDNSRCGNFGVRGNMNNVINKVKFDTNCLCLAFGGPITMVSGFRNGDPRNHGKGLAIDIKENNYGNREKDAMFIVMLLALRYNIGSYHPGFGSFHADRASVNRWQTWSGVAHTNYQGGYARNYYQQIQDALSLVGKPAVSAGQFTSSYGRPSTDEMSKAASAVIEAKGSETMKKCLKASTI